MAAGLRPICRKGPGASSVVKVHLELEGEVTEVFSALSRIVGGAPDVAWSPAGPQTAAAEWIRAETPTVPFRSGR